MLDKLNKVLESRVRLGIMAVLAANDQMDHRNMRELLDLTDGNLASHVSALQKAGYVTAKKRFIGKKPNTTYSATKKGRDAFTAHLDALEQLIKRDLTQ